MNPNPSRRRRSPTRRGGRGAAISIMLIIARGSPCGVGRDAAFSHWRFDRRPRGGWHGEVADAAQNQWHHLLDYQRYAALILTPAGFGLALFLARRFFQNSQGSGIPQVIAARALPDVESRLSLVSLRVAAGKIAVMMLGLLCGASIGREGPTVQVGAAIMFAAGRRALHYQRGLLLAGAAAGIAAAFNTPLAGIVFGIEELSRSFESRTSGLVSPR